MELPVVFATEATEEFEHDDEGDDANAGRGEHAVGGDVPGLGDEALRDVSILCTVRPVGD